MNSPHTIEAQWADFKRCVLDNDPNITPNIAAHFRKMFYCGFQGALLSLRDAALNDADAAEWFDQRRAEFMSAMGVPGVPV